MPGLMDGKVVVVTGGGRGVGRGIALDAAREGAAVVVNDLGVGLKGEGEDASPAEQVVAEIEAMGGAAVADGHSVTEWDSAHALVQTAIDKFGRIDILINNAGILRDVFFHKMTEEEFDSVIAVHLKGSFNVSRAAAPHFKAQNSGAYVHMTSTSGLIGNFGQANYAAAKLGIVGLSKSIALDMGRFGVTSNCIAPFAWSRLIGTIPINSDKDAARIEKAKQGTPAKIAPLAVALASEEGKNVSGQIFTVRLNEIYLMSQSRPIRSVHTAEGWTPEGVVETAFPAFSASFSPLDRSGDVFTWDPI